MPKISAAEERLLKAVDDFGHAYYIAYDARQAEPRPEIVGDKLMVTFWGDPNITRVPANSFLNAVRDVVPETLEIISRQNTLGMNKTVAIDIPRHGGAQALAGLFEAATELKKQPDMMRSMNQRVTELGGLPLKTTAGGAAQRLLAERTASFLEREETTGEVFFQHNAMKIIVPDESGQMADTIRNALTARNIPIDSAWNGSGETPYAGFSIDLKTIGVEKLAGALQSTPPKETTSHAPAATTRLADRVGLRKPTASSPGRT